MRCVPFVNEYPPPQRRESVTLHRLLLHSRPETTLRRPFFHAFTVRPDLQARGRDRPVHPPRARGKLLHPRDQRQLERHRAHAARVQQHSALRGPGVYVSLRYLHRLPS